MKNENRTALRIVLRVIFLLLTGVMLGLSFLFYVNNPSETQYFISIVVTFVLTGLLAFYAWEQREMTGAIAFMLMELVECLLALSDIFSLLSGSQAQALFWFNLRYLFIAFIPVIWLAFSLAYGGYKTVTSSKLLAVALVIPILTQIIRGTNNLHGFWLKQDVAFHQSGPYWIVETAARVPGPWFMVHSIYGLILLLVGVVVVLLSARGKAGRYRAQTLLLTAGALIAWSTTLIQTFKFLPNERFNPFIPGIGFSALIFALAIFRFQFLVHSPARETGPSMAGMDTQSFRLLVLFIFVFVLMVTGIGVVGYMSYQNYEKQFRSQVEGQLTAIAELKVNELVDWRKERLGNAASLFGDPAFTELARRVLENPADQQAREQLGSWLGTILESYSQYDRVFLLDAQAVERLSVPSSPEQADASQKQNVLAAVRLKQITFLDFQRSSSTGSIYLAIVVPILARDDASQPLGALVLRIDPQTYLYPFINEWPTNSASAETFLVRRDGDSVLYLNELRFKKDSALTLRVPLTSTGYIAVKSISGRPGIMEGLDYLGAPALADARPVPDSPWFLIAKMGLTEVYEPVSTRVWELLVLFAALVVASGAGLGAIWRQQRLRFYKMQYETAESLRKSQEQYLELFENTPDGIFIADANGKYTAVNPSGCALLGYTRDELLARNLSELIAPADLAVTPVRIGELREGKPLRSERRLIRKDGSLVAVEISGRMLPDGRLQSIVRDITERKRVEDVLRQSEYKYRALVENLPVGVVVHASDTSILLSNSMASQLLGLTLDQLQGKKAIDPAWCFVGESGEILSLDEYPVNQALAGSEPIKNLVLGIVRPGLEGPTWVQCNAHQIWSLDGALQQVVVTFIDITKRKRVEEELKRSNAELEQFAYVASHDLQEPLRMVASYTQLLAQRYENQLDEKAKKYIDYAVDGAVRMQQLINDLLMYSRVNTRGRSADLVDAHAILGEVLTNLSVAIQESQALVTSEDLPVVRADATQLHQLLQNLISNGIKFCKAERPHVHISVSDQGKEWRFAVQDNGIGIEQQYADRIFVIFQRLHTRQEYPGTGIGLAVCKRIIERHGGNIWFESQLGQGTTFYFTLPK